MFSDSRKNDFYKINILLEAFFVTQKSKGALFINFEDEKSYFDYCVAHF